MKHSKGRRLTRKMKEFLKGKGLNPDNLLYIQSTSEGLHVIHIHSINPQFVHW